MSANWLENDAVDELANRTLLIDEDDDLSYDNYVESTIDPGNILFTIALFMSLCSLACVPLVAKLGKWILKIRGNECDTSDSRGGDREGLRSKDGALAASTCGHQASRADLPESQSSLSLVKHCQKAGDSAVRYLRDNILKSRKRGAYNTETVVGRQAKVSRGMEEEARASKHFHQMEALRNVRVNDQATDAGVVSSSLPDGSEKVVESLCGSAGQSDIPPIQVKNDSEGILQLMWTIVRYDHESKRILRLAIPFSCSAIAKTSSELFILAIISNTLGTDDMVAYSMTYGVVGISFACMGGWHDAVTTLVSMAYGAENYELAGQYLQTACIMYIVCEIPMGLIWYLTMEKILLLMGFGVSVVQLGHGFVWVRVLVNMMTGINQSLFNFLSSIEHETFANVMHCIYVIANAIFVALAAYLFDVSLVVLGLVLLVNSALVFFLVVIIPIKMGWVEKFEVGLIGSCAWFDREVLKDVFKVALPLAFGSVLAYAEWEILTFFAATLGPAEAATWSLMGFIWDLFESTTEAIGDASEIRVAYQLGKGRPAMAKLAGYKCILLGLIVSILITIVFISLTDVLPSLLTSDATMQAMLAEMFPLVALGNITMSMGMVCWTVIGAQGRYHLSTSVAMAMTFVVTIPLGAVLSIGMNINLQGLVFAVVTGCSLIAMVLFALILMSDWEALSKKIQEQVSADDLSDSSGDDWSCSSSRNLQHQAVYTKIKLTLS
jgi:MATE family multidrug resistance protein